MIGDVIVDTHLDHSDSYRSLEKLESVSQSDEAKIAPYSSIEVVDQASMQSKKWTKVDRYQEKFKSRQSWDVGQLSIDILQGDDQIKLPKMVEKMEIEEGETPGRDRGKI